MIKVWLFRDGKRVATAIGQSLTCAIPPEAEEGDRLVMMTRDRIKAPVGWENVGVGAFERTVTEGEATEVILVLKEKPKAVEPGVDFFSCPECGQLIGLTLKSNLRVHTYGQLEERCSGSGFKVQLT